MPEEKRTAPSQPHQLILQNRSSLLVSGVSEVVRFDDETVVLHTTQGMLTVEGSRLQINRLSVEAGDLVVEGKLNSFFYTDKRTGRGRLGNMFR